MNYPDFEEVGASKVHTHLFKKFDVDGAQDNGNHSGAIVANVAYDWEK